jgi:8-oxo-dGTP diphosphatase
MFQKRMWPFISVCLSEIVEGDRLKAIKSGCSKRTRRLLTILDYDAASRWVQQTVGKFMTPLARWVLYLASRMTLGNLPPPVAVAAIVERDGKILLIARNDGLGLGLPGGIIKWNETVEEALRREVSEETGYEIAIAGLVGIYSGPYRDPRFSSVTIVYASTIVDGLGKSSWEGEIAWMAKGSLPGNLAFNHEIAVMDYLKGRVRPY